MNHCYSCNYHKITVDQSRESPSENAPCWRYEEFLHPISTTESCFCCVAGCLAFQTTAVIKSYSRVEETKPSCPNVWSLEVAWTSDTRYGNLDLPWKNYPMYIIGSSFVRYVYRRFPVYSFGIPDGIRMPSLKRNYFLCIKQAVANWGFNIGAIGIFWSDFVVLRLNEYSNMQSLILTPQNGILPKDIRSRLNAII